MPSTLAPHPLVVVGATVTAELLVVVIIVDAFALVPALPELLFMVRAETIMNSWHFEPARTLS